jgi:signal transduction histidine kinase
MSLRIRLTLLLSLVVAISLFLAWQFTRRAMRPFTDEVLERYLDTIHFVADELGSGKDPKRLGKRLGLQIRRVDHPPRFVEAIREGTATRRCQRRLHDGREIFFCFGRRAPVAVALDDGWVMVRRDLDVQGPAQRIGYTLLVIAFVVIVLCAWIAVLVLSPLRASITAMERMAGGDLSHRLPQRGSRELTEVGRAFNAMADRVENILRAEKELMAGISHELRTPLARLRLEIELLRDQQVPEKRLGAMEKDLEEIDRLIGELLEMSRLSLGERRLEEREVDLMRVAKEAAERNPLPEHRLIVEGHAEPLMGDHDRLVRVVGNLIQNAGKYAPAGTEVRVTVDGRRIGVLDQGPGIPPEDLARLFEPFYRGVRERSKSTGLGLGLMLSQRIVSLHGGSISARNAEDGGLAITIELPEDRSRAPSAPLPTS